MKTNKKYLEKSANNLSLAGSIRRSIDIFRLRRLPKPRHITGRLPSIDKAYSRQRIHQKQLYGDNPPCPLCEDIANRQVIASTATMSIVKNDFPYYMFDGRTVSEHIMLLPKRHVAMLADFTPEETKEYWQLYQQYDRDGYNSMTRPTGNSRRSIPGHVHTHLFKLNNDRR